MDDVMRETDRLILRKINKDDYLEIASILQDCVKACVCLNCGSVEFYIMRIKNIFDII